MKHSGFTYVRLTLVLHAMLCYSAAQNLSLLFVDQSFANAQSSFFGGTPPTVTDSWNGAYDLALTGPTNGNSSLPNPGLNSSASSSFSANHSFSSTQWNLSGNSSSFIDSGLGNLGAAFNTIQSSSGVGASFTFSVDSPFALSLQSSLTSQFAGNNAAIIQNISASTKLFAIALDGVFTNQYLVNWDTFLGSSGGSFDGSWSSAVLRLEFGASTSLGTNIPNAFGTGASSYDLQLSVSPIPEPSGALLALLGGGWFLGLRRRRA